MVNTQFQASTTSTIEDFAVETESATVQEASVVEISNKPIDFQDRIELLENAWRMLPAMEMYHCGKCGNYYSTDGDPHKC